MEERILLPDADITLQDFIPENQDLLFDALYEEVAWVQRSVRIYGQDIPQPRLVAWYGEHSYTYSGIRWDPKAWIPTLLLIKKIVSREAASPFNGVLLNLYRDGKDSIGAHSDDEPEFGENPVIASLSLGAPRDMTFFRKDKTHPNHTVTLHPGSLLIMRGTTQRFWKHGIGKTKHPEDAKARINLTFRNILFPN
jgi:alkylated DNA repair dioxygenase AlkB